VDALALPSLSRVRCNDTIVPGARALLRLDGVFEMTLGLLLATSPLTAFRAVQVLPTPASPPVVVGFGLLLIPVGFALWVAARGRGPKRSVVQALALVNGVGALIFALWVLIGHASFRSDAAILVLRIAVVLGALAAFQARAALAAR